MGRGSSRPVRVAPCRSVGERISDPDRGRRSRTCRRSSGGRIARTSSRNRRSWARRSRRVGSWTIKQRLRERGVEPDECYTLGPRHDRMRPDIAIEVVWTSGGIDKLDVYRGLDVPEVWFWRDGSIEIWVLEAERYQRRAHSSVLVDRDVVRLAEFVTVEGHSAAQRRYVDVLRAGR
ncbi:MAG: Uma2 family endonuclease [Planctomycetes bacterium]|nr:Uma2 family endonuclease [Planctomycetota bacterium]